jgi:hypothetical protein
MPAHSSPNDCGEESLPSIQATYAGAKRRIATLEQQLMGLQEERGKQKT